MRSFTLSTVPLSILNKVCAHSRNNSSLHSNIYCRCLCNPTVTACCCRYPKPTIIVCALSRDRLFPSVSRIKSYPIAGALRYESAHQLVIASVSRIKSYPIAGALRYESAHQLVIAAN
jgi:hypothetical protein